MRTVFQRMARGGLRAFLAAAMLSAGVVGVRAQEPASFTAQVEGMWRAGDYAGVLALAQQRLAADTNDLPGLLLKFECEIAYLQLGAATNTASEILRVAPQIDTPCFSAVRQVILDDAQCALDLLPHYPPDEYASDLARVGTITNKSLACDFAIQALEEDGYFQ